MPKAAFLLLTGTVLALAAAPVAPGSAEAQQLTYRPTNPAFGGNPLNQQWLMRTAEAQLRSEGTDPFGFDPLTNFQEGLRRQVLSAVSRELVASRFGDQIDLTEEARYDLGDFVIDILPGADGVQIHVLDTLTGDQTTVTIPRPGG